MKLYFFIVTLTLFYSLSLFAQNISEDWVFTPSDYLALKAEGKLLSFHPKSKDLPRLVRENLLKTIDFTLTHPEHSSGVHLFDFFHGHVVCPKPNSLDSKSYNLRLMYLTRRKYYEYDVFHNEPWQKFVQYLEDYDKTARESIEIALEECDNPLMVYHTFEHNRLDSFPNDDQRRHLLSYFGEEKPFSYFPEIDYRREYFLVAQIIFLINKQGVIHATIGTEAELSVFFGTFVRRNSQKLESNIHGDYLFPLFK